MTAKEKKALQEIHEAILHPETGLNRKVNYLLEDIQVNGDKGLENILKRNYEVTYELRTKKDLKLAMKKYLDERPIMGKTFGLLTDKRILVVIIGALVTYTGHSQIGGFVIKVVEFWAGK